MRLGLMGSGLSESQSGAAITSTRTSSHPITAGAFLGPLGQATWIPRHMTLCWETAIILEVHMPMRLLRTLVDGN